MYVYDICDSKEYAVKLSTQMETLLTLGYIILVKIQEINQSLSRNLGENSEDFTLALIFPLKLSLTDAIKKQIPRELDINS